MLDAHAFNRSLSQAGIDFFTGVPCSLLGALMQSVEKNGNYIGATIEGEALALAAGAWLAGKNTAVLLQNSGLGNLVNTLTSLNTPFRIPSLLIIGWRGMPGMRDEPQHETMGHITPQLLDLMHIPYHIIPDDNENAYNIIEQSVEYMAERRTPVALLVKPGLFANAIPQHETAPHAKNASAVHTQHKVFGAEEKALPSRHEVLTAFSSVLPTDMAVIATTGKCGRELFSINDNRQQLYMVGAMGSASAVGAGAAMHTDKYVVVLDGDGAALMRLGTFAVIGREQPENLIHIVLDNGAHDSTGGQATGSEKIDFCAIAAACGYAISISAFGLEALVTAIQAAKHGKGPHFIHVPISKGSQPDLLRPTVSPAAVADRFRDFLHSKP